MATARKSVTAASKSEARSIESNPLFRLSQGMQAQAAETHRKTARVGNLFFEYVQNVQNLRGVVTAGEQVAEFLESLDLIVWDRDGGTYMWKSEPLMKAEFLRLIRPLTAAK